MDSKFDLILSKLEKIENEIDQIKTDIDQIKRQTQNMDNHIEFINGVYDKVESPLNFITDKFNSLIYGAPEPKLLKEENETTDN